MTQKVNELMSVVESNSHYKTRLEEIMKMTERGEKEMKENKEEVKEMKEEEEVKEEKEMKEEEVKEEDLEKEVVQLKQEKALLLLDLKEISNQLEEKIPSFQ